MSGVGPLGCVFGCPDCGRLMSFLNLVKSVMSRLLAFRVCVLGCSGVLRYHVITNKM